MTKISSNILLIIFVVFHFILFDCQLTLRLAMEEGNKKKPDKIHRSKSLVKLMEEEDRWEAEKKRRDTLRKQSSIYKTKVC